MGDQINTNETKPLLQPSTCKQVYHGVSGWRSKRWILAYVGFLQFLFMYAIRVNINLAIVCMVNSTDDGSGNTSNTMNGTEHGDFNWNKAQQSGVLSSYFYGYAVTQILGGWLAGRFSGKHVIAVGMLIQGFVTFLIPIGAQTNIIFVYIIRVIQGLASGVIFPAFYNLWGKWAPPMESSKLTTFCYSGCVIGTVLTFVVSGVLCKYGFDGGWPSVFYITGGLSLISTLFWVLIVADSPNKHKSITREERDYIVAGIGTKTEETVSTPWLAIATSKALWVCLLTHATSSWSVYTLQTSLPTFMKEVLKFDVQENGLLSSLPFMMQGIVSVVAGQVVDCLRSKGFIKTRNIRRLVQVLSFIGTGGCLIGAGFISPQNRAPAVIILVIATGFAGLGNAGFMVNHIDFAPKYAGVLFGITNTCGSISGILAPVVASALTPDKTQKEWRNVFYICAALGTFGAIIFGGFAKTDLEPWARENKEMRIN